MDSSQLGRRRYKNALSSRLGEPAYGRFRPIHSRTPTMVRFCCSFLNPPFVCFVSPGSSLSWQRIGFMHRMSPRTGACFTIYRDFLSCLALHCLVLSCLVFSCLALHRAMPRATHHDAAAVWCRVLFSRLDRASYKKKYCLTPTTKAHFHVRAPLRMKPTVFVSKSNRSFAKTGSGQHARKENQQRRRAAVAWRILWNETTGD
jgi:hypothetical protein